MLKPLRFNLKPKSLLGLTLILFGLLLIGGGASFFVYTWRAHSNLDSLVYKPPDASPAEESGSLLNKRSQNSPDNAPAAGPASAFSPQAIASQSLYPGEVLNPGLWTNPLYGADAATVDNPILEGFEPLSPEDLAQRHSLPPATRISIPAIGVESKVEGLEILDLGDSRAYETPKNVVGHIPKTSNAGENGASWYFGHLESPILGEGNVFFRLPEIPRLLRQGIDVYATVDNGSSTYLYQLAATEVVHEDDLALYENGDGAINLVACVPRLVYDYRLIVTGKLIGVKHNSPSPQL